MTQHRRCISLGCCDPPDAPIGIQSHVGISPGFLLDRLTRLPERKTFGLGAIGKATRDKSLKLAFVRIPVQRNRLSCCLPQTVARRWDVTWQAITNVRSAHECLHQHIAIQVKGHDARRSDRASDEQGRPFLTIIVPVPFTIAGPHAPITQGEEPENSVG